MQRVLQIGQVVGSLVGAEVEVLFSKDLIIDHPSDRVLDQLVVEVELGENLRVAMFAALLEALDAFLLTLSEELQTAGDGLVRQLREGNGQHCLVEEVSECVVLVAFHIMLDEEIRVLFEQGEVLVDLGMSDHQVEVVDASLAKLQ